LKRGAKKNVVNNVNMSNLKSNTQNNTKHVEHQDATDIQKNNYILCFSDFLFLFIYVYLNDFSKKIMLSYRLGTVNGFHCGRLNQF